MKHIVLAGGILAICLTGCSGNDQNANDTGMGDYTTRNTQEINDASDNRRAANPLQINNYSNDFSISERAEQRVEALKEIRRAKVLLKGDTAYVAAELSDRNTQELKDNVKKKITAQVKGADEHVHQVYVSTNPDFMQRIEEYGHDLKSGRPITGLGDEIGTTIRNVFPEKNK